MDYSKALNEVVEKVPKDAKEFFDNKIRYGKKLEDNILARFEVYEEEMEDLDGDQKDILYYTYFYLLSEELKKL